ncbi:hypothetical protein F5Y16DRAFT_371032 [Xylariaceae sp. FL0255]|nr:hypothetical protein F5Y16DRAFT_371032 [Xylariaceae sp. FL0255]
MSETVFWSFKDQAHEKSFYSALAAKTGIERNDTYIGYVDYRPDAFSPCFPWQNDGCIYLGFHFHIPLLANSYNDKDVTNPKDTISKYLGKLGPLQDGLPTAVAIEKYSAHKVWSGRDMVDAVSLPVLMIHSAKESMQKIYNVGKKIEEEERKATILAFIALLLFLIPIGGEVLDAIGFAVLGRLLVLAGDLASMGYDIYGLANDPSSAPSLNFDLVLGGKLTDEVEVAKAAKARRLMSEEPVHKLGKAVSACRKGEQCHGQLL